MKAKKLISTLVLALGILMLTACGKSEPQVLSTTLNGMAGNFTVEGNIPKGAQFVVTWVDSLAFDQLLTQNGHDGCIAYSMSLMSGTKELQPDGTVTVTVPWPEGVTYDPTTVTYNIAYIDNNANTMEIVPMISIDSSSIKFEATHFSIYALIMDYPDNYSADLSQTDSFYSSGMESPLAGVDSYFMVEGDYTNDNFSTRYVHLTENFLVLEVADYDNYSIKEYPITFDPNMGVPTANIDGTIYYIYYNMIHDPSITTAEPLNMSTESGDFLYGTPITADDYDMNLNDVREIAKQRAEEKAKAEEEARLQAEKEAEEAAKKAEEEKKRAEEEAKMTPEERKAKKYGKLYKSYTATCPSHFGSLGTITVEFYGNSETGTAVMQINGKEVTRTYYSHPNFEGSGSFLYVLDDYKYTNGYIMEFHETGNGTAEIWASEGQDG